VDHEDVGLLFVLHGTYYNTKDCSKTTQNSESTTHTRRDADSKRYAHIITIIKYYCRSLAEILARRIYLFITITKIIAMIYPNPRKWRACKIIIVGTKVPIPSTTWPASNKPSKSATPARGSGQCTTCLGMHTSGVIDARSGQLRNAHAFQQRDKSSMRGPTVDVTSWDLEI
jgi:hypothetical protein